MFLQSPLSGEKKSASTFLLPKKKIYIWWRATIRGALAGRRSTLGVNIHQIFKSRAVEEFEDLVDLVDTFGILFFFSQGALRGL